MNKRGHQNTLRSFDELGDFMKNNGSNVLEQEDALNNNSENNQTYYAFGSEENIQKDKVEYVETKESYNAFEAEDKLLNEIEEAQNILDGVSGIPGSHNTLGEIIEPNEEISEVSDNNNIGNGVVSENDSDDESRLSQAEVVSDEIEHLDAIIDNAIDNGVSKEELEKATVMRLRLSEENKNIIRETSPELFTLINENDIETISSFESKLDSIKGKKKIGEKIRELLKKKIITNTEVDNFNSAKQRRDIFMDKAKELNVPIDVAKIIYKADPVLINEVRGITKEEVEKEATSIDINPESPILEQVEHIDDEEEVLYEDSIKGDLKKKGDFYKRLVDGIPNNDERERLVNAIKFYNENVDRITNEDTVENHDLISDMEDYSNGLEKNIKEILNIKNLPKEKTEELESEVESEVIEEKAEEEIRGVVEEIIEDITEEVSQDKIEVSKENIKSDLENKIDKLHTQTARCREAAQKIVSTPHREKILHMIKTLEDNSRLIFNNEHLEDKDKVANIAVNINNLIASIDSMYNFSSDEDLRKSSSIKSIEDNISEKPIKSERNTGEYVLEKYEKFGIGPDALREIEGFESLSDGQKLLMLKNYESVVLSKVKTEGKTEADKEWDKDNFGGKLGRIGLSIITLGTARTFREKRKQKEVATKILHGDYLGFENRQSMLQALVNVAKESPDVHFDKNGELSVDYIDLNKYKENPYSREIISNYNTAASEYSRIPYSWFDNSNTFNGENEKEISYSSKLLGLKYGTLSGKERSKLSDLREDYNKAREEYLKLAIEESGDGIEERRHVLKEINSLDERIRMNQLFVSDPNAEQALQNITDTNVFNQTISEFYSRKGKYMAYGSLLRMSAVATVSSVAAPAAIAIFGGMSYLRGKREARELLKLRRVSGIINENDVKEEMIYDVDLEKSLSDLKILLNNAKEKRDAKTIYHLEARINEVSDKLKSGYKIERKTRKLGEFRDAKFFSTRIEHLVSKYELMKNSEGQREDAKLIEVKIAQTVTLMRELMNNNLLTFGKGEVASSDSTGKNKNDARSITNRLEFIQALALADATISLDDDLIKKKMANVVNLRREKIDEISNKKALNHIAKAVTTSVAFAGAGYALTHIGSEFFGDSTSESVIEGIHRVRSGEGIEGILKDNIHELDDLSSHAQSNAISNFINRLNTEQLREIGITNPHKLTPGQEINVEKLEQYFNSTRINGRTLIENAELITGRGGKGTGVSRLINDMVDDYKANLREPSDTAQNIEAHHVVGHSNPNEVSDIVAGSHARHFEDVKEIENEWSTLSAGEKLTATETLIPTYLKNQIGEQNVNTFMESSKNMSASSLLLRGGGVDNSKITMLENLKEVLKQKGITPDNGFTYQGTLYDYVMKSYRVKVMRDGLQSIK